MNFSLMTIDGGWSPWSQWSDCRCPGSTLSSGKMSTRTCTNPPPSNGGQQCQGMGVRRTKDCTLCPQGKKDFAWESGFTYANLGAGCIYVSDCGDWLAPLRASSLVVLVGMVGLQLGLHKNQKKAVHTRKWAREKDVQWKGHADEFLFDGAMQIHGAHKSNRRLSLERNVNPGKSLEQISIIPCQISKVVDIPSNNPVIANGFKWYFAYFCALAARNPKPHSSPENAEAVTAFSGGPFPAGIPDILVYPANCGPSPPFPPPILGHVSAILQCHVFHATLEFLILLVSDFVNLLRYNEKSYTNIRENIPAIDIPNRNLRKNMQRTQNDILLYIGLTVAVFLICILSFFVVRIYRKKGQHQSLYNMASNDYHPEYFPDHDKKSLNLPPDLTQTVPPCYEYPYNTPAASVTRSVSEHHYDVPHLASADSTYEVATEAVTLPLPAAYAATPTTSGNYTSSAVSHSGAFLNLSESGVSLLIPEGAVSRSRKQELFLSILNEDCFRPKLAENITQLSPVVSCGPNVALNKSVILKIPHCAELRNNWSISVLQSDCSDSQWQSAVTLGQETINTSVYCQLDKDACYLVTECLSRFVIVGRSVSGNAIKRLKLAVFSPKLCLQSSSEFSIRVYILEDTDSSMETVFGQEKRLGGYLLDEPRSVTFQDGGNNLCLNIECLSDGWQLKSASDYQEIPFRQIWQANSNSLHCSFTLEAVEVSRHLSFKIRINQKGFDYQQVFDITCKDDGETISNKTSSVKLHHNELVPKITIQSETSKSSDSKKSVEFSHSPKSAKSFKLQPANPDELSMKLAKNSILTDRGVSTCDDFNFRLNKSMRKQLCQCLDPPTAKGNDWRMLAQALNVDRYINFFATKPSPTDCILDLWEARNRDSKALTDIRQIFNEMKRPDAMAIMDACLGPNWL
ncbi:unnamed protein product [Brassicogethes aeneus]|uniref:Netrin receptor UNC5 n=1 Tax=Brassicogethes aeneus TaxID=1431903 RepID=A0A9P0FK25_BRAAE|nr:unnamed protein product [Brassicogethes aeneus]